MRVLSLAASCPLLIASAKDLPASVVLTDDDACATFTSRAKSCALGMLQVQPESHQDRISSMNARLVNSEMSNPSGQDFGWKKAFEKNQEYANSHDTTYSKGEIYDKGSHGNKYASHDGYAASGDQGYSAGYSSSGGDYIKSTEIYEGGLEHLYGAGDEPHKGGPGKAFGSDAKGHEKGSNHGAGSLGIDEEHYHASLDGDSHKEKSYSNVGNMNEKVYDHGDDNKHAKDRVNDKRKRLVSNDEAKKKKSQGANNQEHKHSTTHHGDKSYDKGYVKGYNTGYSKGHEKGYDQGYEKGYNQGYDNGYDMGYVKRKKNAHVKKNNAHNQGHDKGYNQGYDNGYDMEYVKKKNAHKRGHNERAGTAHR